MMFFSIAVPFFYSVLVNRKDTALDMVVLEAVILTIVMSMATQLDQAALGQSFPDLGKQGPSQAVEPDRDSGTEGGFAGRCVLLVVRLFFDLRVLEAGLEHGLECGVDVLIDNVYEPRAGVKRVRK